MVHGNVVMVEFPAMVDRESTWLVSVYGFLLDHSPAHGLNQFVMTFYETIGYVDANNVAKRVIKYVNVT